MGRVRAGNTEGLQKEEILEEEASWGDMLETYNRVNSYEDMG